LQVRTRSVGVIFLDLLVLVELVLVQGGPVSQCTLALQLYPAVLAGLDVEFDFGSFCFASYVEILFSLFSDTPSIYIDGMWTRGSKLRKKGAMFSQREKPFQAREKGDFRHRRDPGVGLTRP
jgi:hypothetical protein